MQGKVAINIFTMMDVQTYQQEFTKLNPLLTSYVYRLIAHQQNTTAIVQQTHHQVFKNLASFNQEEVSFKVWVFAIATQCIKTQLKKTQTWQTEYQEIPANVEELRQWGKEHLVSDNFVLQEHIDYCFTHTSKKLLFEEQACVILREIYAFGMSEIKHIVGLSEGQVRYGLTNAKARLRSIFDSRCSLINQHGVCNQCAQLNEVFCPQEAFDEVAQKIPLIKQKNQLTSDQLLGLRLQLVQSINPLRTKGFAWHNYMLENEPSPVK